MTPAALRGALLLLALACLVTGIVMLLGVPAGFLMSGAGLTGLAALTYPRARK